MGNAAIRTRELVEAADALSAFRDGKPIGGTWQTIQFARKAGMQPTIVPSHHLKDVVLGIGAAPEHVHVVDAHPRKVDEMAALIRKEIDHRGLSVVITVRECIEATKRRKKERKGARP